MIALVIAGIVLATGLPALQGFRHTLVSRQASAMLIQDLRAARQLAVVRHYPVAVAFGNGVATTGLTSYSVLVDTNGDRVAQAGEWKFSRTLPEGASFASVELAPTDSVIFDLSGALLPGTGGGRIIVVSSGRNDTLCVSTAGMVYKP